MAILEVPLNSDYTLYWFYLSTFTLLVFFLLPSIFESIWLILVHISMPEYKFLYIDFHLVASTFHLYWHYILYICLFCTPGRSVFVFILFRVDLFFLDPIESFLVKQFLLTWGELFCRPVLIRLLTHISFSMI